MTAILVAKWQLSPNMTVVVLLCLKQIHAVMSMVQQGLAGLGSMDMAHTNSA